MSECGQSALKDFVTKKLKSPKCNGDDGKYQTSATVKYISQNSYPLRNLNFYRTGLAIYGLGLPFLSRSAGGWWKGHRDSCPSPVWPTISSPPNIRPCKCWQYSPLLNRKIRTFFVCFLVQNLQQVQSDSNSLQITFNFGWVPYFHLLNFNSVNICLLKKSFCFTFILFILRPKHISNAVCTCAFMFRRQGPLGLAFVCILIFFPSKIK